LLVGLYRERDKWSVTVTENRGRGSGKLKTSATRV
jgi:hypothetical protein